MDCEKQATHPNFLQIFTRKQLRTALSSYFGYRTENEPRTIIKAVELGEGLVLL
jgi:hypothetical protein